MANERLLNGAVDTAKYLVRRWPQVDPETQTLHYYFVGSLGLTLSAATDQINDRGRLLTPLTDPGVFRSLQKFPREIGDFDLAILHPTADHLGTILDTRTNVYLHELPETSLPFLKPKYHNPYMVIDGVTSYSPHETATASIGDKAFYVRPLRSSLGYKVFNAVVGFGIKPDQYNRDFAILEEAALQLERREDLVGIAYEIISTYEKERNKLPVFENPDGPVRAVFMGVRTPEQFKSLIDDDQASAELKQFLREIKDLDQQNDQVLS